MRLNAYLARAGIASRRKADELVAEERVTVNGKVANYATFVEDGDRVKVDGRTVELEPLSYVLLYKPSGVVTTAHDPQGRRTVVDIVGHPNRVVPVGRLDADTTGALLLTNDGQLAHLLAHPRYEIDKVYEALVSGIPSPSVLERLAEGVELDDGRTAPARVRMLSHSGHTATVEIVLHEGRKHQVKRMCAAVGHPVSRLHRVAYAGLQLEGLAPGESRELLRPEVNQLKALAREQHQKAAQSD